MDFAYGESFTESCPEAYERLILDVLLGDADAVPAPRRRWSCPGRSSTRSRSTGPGTASPRSTRPAPGDRSRPTRCSHETDGAGAGHEDRPARTPLPARSTRRWCRAAARSAPRPSGMVLTLVIVTDEENAYDALKAADDAVARAPLAHRWSSSSGSPAARAAAPTPGWTPRCGSAPTPAPARPSCCGCTASWPTTPTSVVLPLLLPDAPVVVWWPGDAPGEPAEGPAGRAGAAPDHRRVRRREPAGELSPVRADVPARRHRPGLDPDHAVALDAGGGAGPGPRDDHLGDGRGRGGQPERRAAGRVARRRGWASRSTRIVTDGPGITAVRLEHRGRRRSRSTAPGRLAGHALHARASRTAPVALKRRETAELHRRGAAPAGPGRRLRASAAVRRQRLAGSRCTRPRPEPSRKAAEPAAPRAPAASRRRPARRDGDVE